MREYSDKEKAEIREDSSSKDLIVLSTEWKKIKKKRKQIAEELKEMLDNSEEEIVILSRSVPIFMKAYAAEMFYLNLFDCSFITGITKKGNNCENLKRLACWYIFDKKQVFEEDWQEKIKPVIQGYLNEYHDSESAIRYIYDKLGNEFADFLAEFYKFDKEESRLELRDKILRKLEEDLDDYYDIPEFEIYLPGQYLPNWYFLYKDWFLEK